MTDMVFQILVLTGVWLGVVLLNAIRKCAEKLSDRMAGPDIDELHETLRSVERRIEALAGDYHKVYPALRNVDDDIY